MRNDNLECWMHDALYSLPMNISLYDALKIEEKLKEIYKELTGKEYM